VRPNVRFSGAAGRESGIFGAGARTGFDRTEDAVEHFCQRSGELRPKAPFEGCVILRSAEKITDELAERGAAVNKLDHAGGHGAAQEASVIDGAGDVRGHFEIGGKNRCAPGGDKFRAGRR